ncbi:hypothetical protein [Marinimicrobium alkaliphilum]|uniref:hypothetical protein n=1 Tax=Marinimicrobium alkaliphilum TaxID=2202654 RepID=UPI001300445B|nr:hypothetical protein [Marinimicrobium alkaliphilum]
MKKTLSLVLLTLWASYSMACDEDCKRERAMEEHGVRFGSHLTVQACRDTAVDFLMTARRNMENYRAERLEGGHPAGMRNIRNFIEQRKSWLDECDEYLRLTEQGRVFRTEGMTERLFGDINAVSEELMNLYNNRHNPSREIAEVAQRFDTLFQAMDEHVVDLQLRGQMVIR